MDVRPLALLALLLAMAAPAAAFWSQPSWESEHDAITADALAPLGVEPATVRAFQEAVRHVDSDEMKVSEDDDRLAKADGSFDYAPHHHCDRLPGATHASAFAATAHHVQAEQAAALAFARSRSPERAVRALGYALHAVQDCHSHSNIVDLPPAAQRQLLQSLLEGGPAPEGLLLTGFEPGADDAESPPGDPYPHARFAKDGDNATEDGKAVLPDGRTKSHAARQMATEASRELVQRTLDQLSPQERDAVLKVTAAETPHKVPGAGIWMALGVLACAAAARRRSC